MCDIFRWLKTCGVKSVAKVIVMDMGKKPHSDEAIEASMKGLDVRTWQWYKMDLCTNVIWESAPRAEDVSLCWSGNNAVLMGWSSPAGLTKLKEVNPGCFQAQIAVLWPEI
ncbi:hypothetical protein K456DRAFT_1920901 [Colletotrichum gloeosporioides 23]|nr:hypothetical protein K456DRAFT_1920901 [Colletotrichum gloeosporioides 23]